MRAVAGLVVNYAGAVSAGTPSATVVPLRWDGRTLWILDQTLLPAREEIA